MEFLGWFEDFDSVYLAMEYIPLGDLESNMPEGAKRLDEPEVRVITFQILEGLRIMHLEAFVHRDLKPKVSHSLTEILLIHMLTYFLECVGM